MANKEGEVQKEEIASILAGVESVIKKLKGGGFQGYGLQLWNNSILFRSGSHTPTVRLWGDTSFFHSYLYFVDEGLRDILRRIGIRAGEEGTGLDLPFRALHNLMEEIAAIGEIMYEKSQISNKAGKKTGRCWEIPFFLEFYTMGQPRVKLSFIKVTAKYQDFSPWRGSGVIFFETNGANLLEALEEAIGDMKKTYQTKIHFCGIQLGCYPSEIFRRFFYSTNGP